jgi:CubicO group peptidase (beta-lactamase class C family)
VAALTLVEDGGLGLDDPVADYIPAVAKLRVAASPMRNADGAFDTVTLARPLLVRDLLTFTSGMGDEGGEGDLGDLYAAQTLYGGSGSLQQRVERVLAHLPLFEQPGTRWRYGWSLDVLAVVMEIATGQTLADILQQRVFDPLGMDATGFMSPPDRHGELARVYTQDQDGNLVLVESSDAEARDWTPGGGGLVSTAGDYLRFALMLWNGGSFDGARVLRPETVAMMTHPQVEEGVLAGEGIEGLGWGLGLAVVVDADATMTFDRTGDFWWAGYYGTTFFVSPATGLVGVVISQNEPGPYSGTPYAVHLAQGFAFAGL